MKLFNETDVRDHTCVAGAGSINTVHGELVSAELPWQKRGLRQSRTGYGAKLTSSWKINFCGKLHSRMIPALASACPGRWQ